LEGNKVVLQLRVIVLLRRKLVGKLSTALYRSLAHRFERLYVMIRTLVGHSKATPNQAESSALIRCTVLVPASNRLRSKQPEPIKLLTARIAIRS
jgi:hypothetical protein